MVYTCQFCGGWFPKDLLQEAMAENQKIITCPYCNNLNEFESVKQSHVKKGYDFLSQGEFFKAHSEFNLAISSTSSAAYESAKLDAYLGRAFALQSIQVVYHDDDQIASHSDEPDLNHFACDDVSFSELVDYQMARKIALNIPFGNASEEVARIERFARKIDGVKAAYNRRANIGKEYQLFVAYEDSSKDSEAGMMAANRIVDSLPSSIKNVYVQDPSDMTYEDYEGALLYAIHNSKCMIVVADDDIDPRLTSLYARYYKAAEHNREAKSRSLGFVSIGNNKQIQLPDDSYSINVFDIDNKDAYCRFICESNMITYGGGSSIFADLAKEAKPKEEEIEEEVEDFNLFTCDTNDSAPVFEGKICKFGSYPQRRVLDPGILSIFEAEGKPTMSSPNGWEIMFRTRTGNPYTWYKDKVIGDKKYRAVYFMKFRDVFISRISDITPSVQRISNYPPMRIYVFSYDSIEWNVVQSHNGSAIVLSSVGLESREFHNKWDESVEWCDSSLRQWMNNEMYNTAFSPEEQKYIYTIDGTDDHLSIISSEFLERSSKHMTKFDSFNISGSDYLRCLGGYCDRTVSSFWVKSEVEEFGNAAAVQPHNVGNIVSQCVDTTTVSVLPLIKVKKANVEQ